MSTRVCAPTVALASNMMGSVPTAVRVGKKKFTESLKGFNMTTNPTPRQTNYTGIVIVAMLGVSLTLWVLAQMGAAAEPRAPDDALAYAMAQVFVSRQLKAPATADYAPMSQATIIDLGDGLYSVTAWVDSENSYGARLRATFTANLRWMGGDDWQLVGVTWAK